MLNKRSLFTLPLLRVNSAPLVWFIVICLLLAVSHELQKLWQAELIPLHINLSPIVLGKADENVKMWLIVFFRCQVCLPFSP